IDRWFEMVVTRRKGDAVSEEKFPYSLTLADNNAKDIGPGSDRVLGDRSTAEITGSVQPNEEVVIISKPRPGYTEAARTKAIQGTITLQVPFLRNGSLGPITVIKGLPEGITEQGLAAAQRMSFLPARVNGVPVTVSKQIEYTFSIY
ncbi:MAG TPA: TonB family protein, partial [Pyrinomonadaceae bacterium]|nr:TonB family protein [Pyrinomonadaceae bacterium]